MTDTSKIQAKIRKLMELARNNPSPAEAALAAQKAQALMDEYRIERAAIERSAKRAPGKIYARVFHRFPRKTQAWVKSLILVIATANNCKSITVYAGVKFLGPASDDTLVFVFGEKEDLDAAQTMFDLLKGQIEYAVDVAPFVKGRSMRHDFRFGAIDAIHERLSESRADTIDSDSTAAEVFNSALARAQKACDLTRERGNGRRGRSIPLVREGKAYKAGEKAGRSMTTKRRKALAG